MASRQGRGDATESGRLDAIRQKQKTPVIEAPAGR
jgi:hypothetical protein